MNEKIWKALRILNDRIVSHYYDDAVSNILTPLPLKTVQDTQWKELEKIKKGIKDG